MSNAISKAKYWSAICYPENMIFDWKDRISGILQLPFCYCVHDKDLLHDGDETRKIHVHIMLMFNNTTTIKHALNIFNLLSCDGCKCCSTCEAIIYPMKIYHYLIHDTEEARKDGKYQYDPADRIEGNNFDIGNFEQLSTSERKSMRKELSEIIYNETFTNYFDFYMYVISNLDSSYEDVVVCNSGHFERLIKGQYLKLLKINKQENNKTTANL